jgi:hypothetical protein
MHLVGFTIEIYYSVWPCERQMRCCLVSFGVTRWQSNGLCCITAETVVSVLLFIMAIYNRYKVIQNSVMLRLIPPGYYRWRMHAKLRVW